MSNSIYVQLKWLQKCDELKDDIEEIKDLWEVNQAIISLKNLIYTPLYIQNLIDRMEKKYAIEIYELETIASKMPSNNYNNSYSKLDNPTTHSQNQSLLKIRFAICFKICKKKCFVKCVEEFIDMTQYK